MSKTPESRGVRVLVIDDYRPFADLLVGILWNHGYEARPAYSAADGLSAAEAFMPHALVLDVLLQDGDGFEVAEQFKQRFPACRVLLTSAWDHYHEPKRVHQWSAVVPKVDLMERLTDFLDGSKPSGQFDADGHGQ